MDYLDNEVIICEFYLEKGPKRVHNSKQLDFRRHGDKRCCKRNRMNDGNFRRRMPKNCESIEYTSVYQARFTAERALEDGFKQKPDSDYDFVKSEIKALIKSDKEIEKAFNLYQILKTYFE